MSEYFKLQANYQPTGDQPQAIKKLIGGLQAGKKEQVLLGVTGSGKSVTGDSAVLTKQGGIIQKRPISEVIEGIFAANETVVQRSGDSEFINMTDISIEDQLETFAFSPESGRSAWEPVKQVSRHSTDRLLRVTTDCGRAVQCTEDHNFYRVRHGKLELTDGNQLKLGDWIPLPRKLDGPERPLAEIDLTAHIGSEYKAYVALTEHDPTLGQIVGKQKYWRMVHASERLGLHDYRRYQVVAGSTAVQAVRIGTASRKVQLSARLILTDTILRFLGYFIAEGHAASGYIVLSTADVQIAEDWRAASAELGVKLIKRRKLCDYQMSSHLLAHILKKWCGQRAEHKRLPVFWPQLSNQQLAQLLSAYFAGDGGVEQNCVSAATVSGELASDIQYALMRFGIVARRRPKLTRYKGGLNKSWVVSISGARQLERFYSEIGFSLLRKQEALCAQLGKTPNTNIDLIPIDGSRFCEVRQQLGMFQKVVAAHLGVSRSYVSMLESGTRLPSRDVATRLVQWLGRLDSASPLVRQFLQDTLILLELHWTRIASIHQRSEATLVYDFAVDSAETFLAGEGGMFVHNTYTAANIIAQRQVPTLVLAHNKTLAAQLYSEFKQFFPDAEVHYFVSYFDYYQPEAYMASSDTYIEKDSKINEEIDRLRHAATAALLSRRDVIIVASVSCIYGIGSVDDYGAMAIHIQKGETRKQDKFLRWLTDIQYQRNDIDFHRGTFRVRGDVVDVHPAGGETAYRIEFFGDQVDRITNIDPLTGEILADLREVKIFPGSHYVTPREKTMLAIGSIKDEMEQRVAWFEKHGKLLEAQRLRQRTKFDVEMLEETGFVKGIENYSRYLTNREPGEQPATLMDYFPDDFLLFIDESHMTLPQVRGMYNGDRARKEVLVEHGFRLPSALDNRPLTFSEFERHINQVIYVSATPGEYELSRGGQPVQQVIRPTGLLDPPIEIRPIDGQIDDLIAEIRNTTAKGQRVLVTTLTKRMAEDLSEYLQELGIKVAYLHSDVDTLDRSDILRDLRAGIYDVLVGINLLREGLDLPEVSLVAIMDADKEGFLRSEQALIQTVGRAARHVEGHVIMYADRVTRSMQAALDETTRRRTIQEAYNTEHGITPTGVNKGIDVGLRAVIPEDAKRAKIDSKKIPKDEIPSVIRELSAQMDLAAANLQFEQAAELRDIITDLKTKL